MTWYEIKAKADVSEVWLYDEIGLYGVGAKQFIAEINSVKSPKIDLHINSPGGEVFDGAAIYNAIRRHPAYVTTYIDGIAASIASVIALAGERVVMAENALYMLHNPFGVTMGNAEDMRKTADILDKVRDTMLAAYSLKSGQTEDQIRAWMDVETWFDSDEAVAAGFVDEISGKIDLAACTKFAPAMEKMGFREIPNFNARKEVPPEKEIERALRSVGCSRKAAKAIIAEGYSGSLRDVEKAEEPLPAEDPPCDAEPLPTPASVPTRIVDRHLRPRYSNS